MTTTYPSKVLLFGEYTIIQNSSALAVPYYKYQSCWSDQHTLSQNTIEASFSKQSLRKIFNDLKTLKKPALDLKQFEKDLNEGLWLCSNSPMGYGLGSSGAVCAAIYNRYGLDKNPNLPQLKEELALLEHSFHGKSSGIDPLIAYLQKAVWVHPNKSIDAILLQNLPKDATFFLVDTQQPRVSTPLIQFFVEQCKKQSFLQNFVQPISDAVEQAITTLVQKDIAQLFEMVGIISRLQLQYLPPMITDNMIDLWQTGLATHDFYLKICGAGGGGFMLGFTPNWQNIQPYLKDFKVLKLDLE